MQKKNIPYIINYSLILIFFLISGIFFRQSFIALFIILLIILPIISIFLLVRNGYKIKVNIFAKTQSVSLGNQIIINVDFYNPLLIPFLNNNLYFKYNNLYYPNEMENVVSLPAIPKSKSSIQIPFDISHLGINEFMFDYLVITDYLHLFSIKVPVKSYIQVSVLPENEHVNYHFSIPPFSDSDEEEQVVNYGQMTHDLKETREYQPGDSIKNIHWKLTAKNDDLTVKVFEQSAERTLILLPELSADTIDNTIVTVYNFSLFLLKQKEFFKIAVFDAASKEFTLLTIETTDDLDKAIYSLYHCKLYEMKRYAINSYHDINGSDKSAIHIIDKSIEFNNGATGEIVTIHSEKEDNDDGTTLL